MDGSTGGRRRPCRAPSLAKGHCIFFKRGCNALRCNSERVICGLEPLFGPPKAPNSHLGHLSPTNTTLNLTCAPAMRTTRYHYKLTFNDLSSGLLNQRPPLLPMVLPTRHATTPLHLLSTCARHHASGPTTVPDADASAVQSRTQPLGRKPRAEAQRDLHRFPQQRGSCSPI